METGRYMTLKDLLGNDYKEIAVQSIENAITGWSEEKKMLLFEDVNLEDLLEFPIEVKER